MVYFFKTQTLTVKYLLINQILGLLMEIGSSAHFSIRESSVILDSKISVNDSSQLWFSRESEKNQRDTAEWEESKGHWRVRRIKGTMDRSVFFVRSDNLCILIGVFSMYCFFFFLSPWPLLHNIIFLRFIHVDCISMKVVHTFLFLHSIPFYR